MNCDQVFEILTRGPFPTGDRSDVDVELHLAACHDCRQLAEALRPAVELMHESVDPSEGADLPGYRGQLVEARSQRLMAAVDQAIGTMPNRPRASRRAEPRLRPGRLGLPRIAAAIVLGLALGVMLRAMGIPADSQNPLAQDAHAPATATVASIATSQQAGVESSVESSVKSSPAQASILHQLASLDIPAGCLVKRPEQDVNPALATATTDDSAAHLAGLLCCTNCHSADNSSSARHTQITHKLTVCVTCHVAN